MIVAENFDAAFANLMGGLFILSLKTNDPAPVGPGLF